MRRMRRGLLLLPLVLVGLLAPAGGLTGAAADDTVAQQIPGELIGVGANQQSLLVGYSNETIPECGTIAAIEPSATYTATSVTVALTAEVTGEDSQYPCAGIGILGTTTISLPQPIAGRAIKGLQILGGAFHAIPARLGEVPSMPNLVGLAPADARALLSVGAHATPQVGLVDHRLRRGGNPVPVVIAQRPAAGRPLRHGSIVVLTIEP